MTTPKPLNKLQCEAIYQRRLPVYRALATMPPANHWPNRPQPFNWRESEIAIFVRRHLPDATKTEVRNIIQTAQRTVGLIRFDRTARLWVGTGDFSKLERRTRTAAVPSLSATYASVADALVGGFEATCGRWNGLRRAFDEVPDLRTRREALKVWLAYKNRMPLALYRRVTTTLRERGLEVPT